jgi:hypothetical protein
MCSTYILFYLFILYSSIIIVLLSVESLTTLWSRYLFISNGSNEPDGFERLVGGASSLMLDEGL